MLQICDSRRIGFPGSRCTLSRLDSEVQIELRMLANVELRGGGRTPALGSHISALNLSALGSSCALPVVNVWTQPRPRSPLPRILSNKVSVGVIRTMAIDAGAGKRTHTPTKHRVFL